MPASTAPAVLAALRSGVDLTSLSCTAYSAPTKTYITATDSLVWLGIEKGGREGGQRALTTNTTATDDANSRWSRIESFLIKGQAISLQSFTPSDEDTPAATARTHVFNIAARVEKWVRANRQAGGALEIEMESMQLDLTNATISSTDYKVATLTMRIRVHSLI